MHSTCLTEKFEFQMKNPQQLFTFTPLAYLLYVCTGKSKSFKEVGQHRKNILSMYIGYLRLCYFVKYLIRNSIKLKTKF